MINTWKLTGGAKLVVEDIPYLRSAAIGVYIQVGSRYETVSLAGASHFIEHMLFKGTPKRTARNIAESFESMGGQLNAFTAKEHTCVYARTLDEDIYSAIDIIFDMLFNSSFLEKDFDTEREVIIEEINMYEDAPDDLIHDVFAKKFWEGNPMGSPILGSISSIREMSRENLLKYYHEQYVPSNLVIAVAGNVEQERIHATIEAIMSQHGVSTLCANLQTPQAVPSFISTLPKEVEQVQICLGVNGISYYDEDRYTQNVLNSILGGGMSSRLFQSLREELGLAYSVYSFATNYSDTGLFSIYIGTGPGKVEKFFEALYAELTAMMEKGVTAEELSRTKKLMKSSVFLGLESVMNRMTRLAKGILMYDKVVAPEEVMEKIYAVNEEQVNLYASRLLQPKGMSMAAIGDKKILPTVENEFVKWWGSRS